MLNKALIVSSIFAFTFSAAHAQTDQQGSTPSSPPPKPPPSTGTTDNGDLYPFESTIGLSSEALDKESKKPRTLKIAPKKSENAKPAEKSEMVVTDIVRKPEQYKDKTREKAKTRQKPEID